MSYSVGNLLDDLPNELLEEFMETILSGRSFRLERIVSQGHKSPEDFWYEQSEHEWVIVLQGNGVLRFEENHADVSLSPGDHVHIPSGCRHRVESTSIQEKTVWLALFYSDERVAI